MSSQVYTDNISTKIPLLPFSFSTYFTSYGLFVVLAYPCFFTIVLSTCTTWTLPHGWATLAFRTKIEMPKSLTDGFPASANVIYVKSTTKPCAAECFKMAKPRHKTNSLVVSQIFNSKFQQIHKISVSGDCMPFMFKICQIVMCIIKYDQSISQIFKI